MAQVAKKLTKKAAGAAKTAVKKASKAGSNGSGGGGQSKSKEPTLHEQVMATIKKLQAKDPGLKQLMKEAHGYVVFPSVGKAALVVGGAYGRGEVFEQGKMIGHATIGQLTLGVQIGGDTFSELIVFESEEPFKRFKESRMKFAANASAVLVKAGASATANFEKGAVAFAYSSGGMLLEAAIGGQKFKFKPHSEEEQGQEQQREQKRGGGKKFAKAQKQSAGGGNKGKPEARSFAGGGDEGEDDQSPRDQGEEQVQETGTGGGGVLARTAGLAKEYPVASVLIGVGLVGAAAVLAARAMGVRSPWAAATDDSESDESDEAAEDQDEDEAEDDGDDQEPAGRRDESGDEDADEDEDDDDTDARAEADEEDGHEDEGPDEEEEDATRHHRPRGGRRF